MVVVTLGVDPEAVIGDSVLLVTAFVQGLQVTQDICVGDHVSLATAQDDRGTVPVQTRMSHCAARGSGLLSPSTSDAKRVTIGESRGARRSSAEGRARRVAPVRRRLYVAWNA